MVPVSLLTFPYFVIFLLHSFYSDSLILVAFLIEFK